MYKLTLNSSPLQSNPIHYIYIYIYTHIYNTCIHVYIDFGSLSLNHSCLFIAGRGAPRTKREREGERERERDQQTFTDIRRYTPQLRFEILDPNRVKDLKLQL